MPSTDLQAHLRGLLAAENRGEKKIYGLKGGARPYLLSLLAEYSGAPLLVISPTEREAENLYQDMAFFLGQGEERTPLETRLHLFPSWEILPFENLSPHPDNVAARLEGLYYLLCGKAPILVSTPAALVQNERLAKATKDVAQAEADLQRVRDLGGAVSAKDVADAEQRVTDARVRRAQVTEQMARAQREPPPGSEQPAAEHVARVVVVEDEDAEADVEGEDEAGDRGRTLPRGRDDGEEGE